MGGVIPDGNLVQIGRGRCHQLSQLTGAEFRSIWEWGLVQCVSNDLSLFRIGLEKPAAVEFAMSNAWAAQPDIAFRM